MRLTTLNPVVGLDMLPSACERFERLGEEVNRWQDENFSWIQIVRGAHSKAAYSGQVPFLRTQMLHQIPLFCIVYTDGFHEIEDDRQIMAIQANQGSLSYSALLCGPPPL